MTADRETAADITALVRWMRSTLGPLHSEFECGSISPEDDAPLSFRQLLMILDGPEAGVRRLDLFGGGQAVREIKAMFAAYRRLRRLEQRIVVAVSSVAQDGSGAAE